MGHGWRATRRSQRWLSQASASRRRVMIAAFARAMSASITQVRFSVQMESFWSPRLCHELARSTTQRFPA